MVRKEERRVTWRGDFACAALTGALVVLFFVPLLLRDPHLFWNDDYQISILPVFADVARSWSEGRLPLLSPYSWMCSNLAGEFQYGTFSVFVNAAVVAIWQLPLAFAQQALALSMVHLVALALGGYLLARGRKVAPPLAMMVGFIAALNGWIVCWGAIDWFGALGAFTWLPWAWWGLERAVERERSAFRFLWPVPWVYLLITGGFPYTVIMLVLLAAWLTAKTVVENRRIAAAWPIVAGMLLGVALAAPAWLPLLEYLQGSAREAQSAESHLQWLVPPAALPALILPAWTVNWADFSTRLLPHVATELACGLVAPVALLWGLAVQRARLVRRIPWELMLLVVVLIASMIPTAGVFRWSFRWLPFLHLILAVCAAEVLRDLSRGIARAALGIVAGAAVAMSVADAAGPFGWPLVAALLLVMLVWLWLDWTGSRAAFLRRWAPAAITYLSLLATYLVVPPQRGVPRYHFTEGLTRAAPLDPQRLYLSVHPTPETAYRMQMRPAPAGNVVRPGSTSMWAQLRFVNGYSPIRPAGVAREFHSTVHGEIPPWMSEYLLEWQAGAEGELARIGVDGIVVAAEIDLAPRPEKEWELAFSDDEGRVYHRVGGPRATVRPLPWIEEELVNGGTPSEGMVLHERREAAREFATASVRVVEESRHHVIVQVDVPAGESPALLAFSRPFFRGYRASIDGAPLTVRSYRGLMPLIHLPAGTNGRLLLVYRPWWLVAGGAVAAVAALVCVSAAAVGLRRNRQYTSRL